MLEFYQPYTLSWDDLPVFVAGIQDQTLASLFQIL